MQPVLHQFRCVPIHEIVHSPFSHVRCRDCRVALPSATGTARQRCAECKDKRKVPSELRIRGVSPTTTVTVISFEDNKELQVCFCTELSFVDLSHTRSLPFSHVKEWLAHQSAETRDTTDEFRKVHLCLHRKPARAPSAIEDNIRVWRPPTAWLLVLWCAAHIMDVHGEQKW